jgi:hypothetical protein
MEETETARANENKANIARRKFRTNQARSKRYSSYTYSMATEIPYAELQEICYEVNGNGRIVEAKKRMMGWIHVESGRVNRVVYHDSATKTAKGKG